MTTATQHAPTQTHQPDMLPPVREWEMSAASWAADGSELTTQSNKFGMIATSPALDLTPGRLYYFDLSVEFIGEGGITFGLQDENRSAWIQILNITGAGPKVVCLRYTPKTAVRVHLALANCRHEAEAVTRIRDLRVKVSSVHKDGMTAEMWKEEARRQWNVDHCGGERGDGAEKGSLEYFLKVERDRYGSYAPWMPKAIGYDKYGGKKVLEIGAGLGTDLAQFAKAGAIVTDFDLAEGHLNMAKRNFEVRGLKAEFQLGDAEKIPFPDATFDVVYSFGVIHHIPDTQLVVDHIHRILKPGGEAIIMVYAKHSFNYWIKDVYRLWWQQGMRKAMTMEEILSANTEFSPNGARPLVKVYTAGQCRQLFSRFSKVRVRKYQLTPGELPKWMLGLASADTWGRLMGWNLIINAVK
ncbi:MAG: class I SAM-dependent methyltransferase [Planctomycetes bacterium]|nr:class I SAM-dependent methyltransferase [Planctomycetota bacterium]